MRTPLDIEADVLATAKELAHRQGVSAGKVVSSLLRSALPGKAPAQRSGAAVVAGFRPFAASDQQFVSTSLITICPALPPPARRFRRLPINNAIALESVRLSQRHELRPAFPPASGCR